MKIVNRAMNTAVKKSSIVKVLHIITSLETGGAEMMLYKLLCKMNRSTIANTVVSLTDRNLVGDEISALGTPVYTLGMDPGFPNPLGLMRLMRIIKAEAPTIIQTWLYHSDLLGIIAGKLMRVPIVLWNIRCSDLDRRDHPLTLWFVLKFLARLSNLPAAIVANSEAGRLASERLGYRSKKWVIIPNGFDLDVFKPSREARHLIRRELGLVPDAFLIGLIARFHPMKDHATFLEAAGELHEMYPKVHFVLVGKDVNSKNTVLKNKIYSLNLVEQVHLLGERRDIPSVTASLDIATCSSYSEGFPNVIGEAMACAVPCVATDVGDCKKVIGNAGVVVPPRDSRALARGWIHLLSFSPEERKAVGLKGRGRVASLFDINHIIQKYETLYYEFSSDLQ